MATDVATVHYGEIVNEVPDILVPITEVWLRTYPSEHTRDAYRRDIRDFCLWLSTRPEPIDPLAVTRLVMDLYTGVLIDGVNDFGRKLSPASIARKLSSLSSWYEYLVDSDHTSITVNPVAKTKRPHVDGESHTVGMSAEELVAMVGAAGDPREVFGPGTATVIVMFMAQIGARVSEVCNAQVDDLGYDKGVRTIRLRMKGRKFRNRGVPGELSALIDAMLTGRGIDPDADNRDVRLFTKPNGTVFDRHDVARLVTRCAHRADLPSKNVVTPHSFRHAWATVAREADATLEERQYALGHADPRTTLRYDRTAVSVVNDPSFRVAAATRSPVLGGTVDEVAGQVA
jgi:integrase/recombinase XerD